MYAFIVSQYTSGKYIVPTHLMWKKGLNWPEIGESVMLSGNISLSLHLNLNKGLMLCFPKSSQKSSVTPCSSSSLVKYPLTCVSWGKKIIHLLDTTCTLEIDGFMGGVRTQHNPRPTHTPRVSEFFQFHAESLRHEFEEILDPPLLDEPFSSSQSDWSSDIIVSCLFLCDWGIDQVHSLQKY